MRTGSIRNENCAGIILHPHPSAGVGYKAAAYDLGAWAVGYLLNKAGQSALLDTFYPNLNHFGWEGAFQKTFGTSSKDFYTDFNQFLEKPITEQLAILPKYK